MAGIAVLDTNIVLYLLAGRSAGGLPLARHRISIITEIELRAFRNLDGKAQSAISSLLQSVEIIGLT